MTAEKVMLKRRWCQSCGKTLSDSSVEMHPFKFEFGFKTASVDLCNNCKIRVDKNILKVNKKYSKILLRLHNRYFQKVLR